MPFPSPFAFKYAVAVSVLEKYFALYLDRNDTQRSAWIMILGVTPNATAVIEAAMYPIGRKRLI